ncbi:MAG: hypothetical protein H6509_00400 [Bryobacterales bacterium]|nr:hypothetical protein [Bryobacterales bacterium]
MLHLALFAAALIADFPGGTVGKADWVSPDHLRVHVEGQADQDSRNRQANWYYFRLDGVKGRPLTIELTDVVGEYNYKPGSHAVSKDTHPVFSYDDATWTNVETVEWDDDRKELRFQITPESDTIWIAHTPPYTLDNLAALEADFYKKPYFDRAPAGWTVEGRPMPLWTIGEAPADAPVIWLMFRQHSWESGTSWAGDGAMRFLLGDSAEADQLRKQFNWKVFPVADPDGIEIGGVRFNVNGYDLNRNWDNIDPKLMPEIAAQHGAIERWLKQGGRIDFFLSLHNTETSEYVEGPADKRALVDLFRRNLTAVSNFEETRAEPQYAAVSSTPGMKGRMTVNQGLYADFQIPAMLMESRVSRHPKLGGRFRSIEDWQAFGAGIIRAAAAAVSGKGL